MKPHTTSSFYHTLKLPRACLCTWHHAGDTEVKLPAPALITQWERDTGVEHSTSSIVTTVSTGCHVGSPPASRMAEGHMQEQVRRGFWLLFFLRGKEKEKGVLQRFKSLIETQQSYLENYFRQTEGREEKNTK